jgi:hypothetical protein
MTVVIRLPPTVLAASVMLKLWPSLSRERLIGSGERSDLG